jgi:hypothetical protein
MALLDMVNVKKSPSLASILRKISEAGGNDKPSAPEAAAKQTNKVNTEESAIDNIKSLFHGEEIE